MDITDIITEEFRSFDGDTTASKLEAALREEGTKAVVILADGEYAGLVTQRQLASAHRDPNAKARNLTWSVGKVDVRDDVRTVARMMVGSAATTLPVFEDETLIGLITGNDLLEKVHPYLEVLTVEDVFTQDLVTITRDTSLGTVMNTLRTERITHLPVVEDGSAVGIVSMFDILDFAGREMQRAQGGTPASAVGSGGGTPHGGFGERAGELERMLDLPAENVMSTPIETTTRGEPLDDAVGTMLENGISSLVVMEDEDPIGIVTKTDVLQALSLTGRTRLPVQITNIDLLDDLSRADVSEMIEDITGKYGDLSVMEANVYLHEHDEMLRGTPLIMARIRLFTDKGHFVGTGEGYGASHALRLAANILEREILEGKDYARTKKHRSEDEVRKLYGWWLSGP